MSKRRIMGNIDMNTIFSSLRPKVENVECDSKSSSKKSTAERKLKLPKERIFATDINSENFYRTPSQHITPIIFDKEFNSAVKKLGFIKKINKAKLIQKTTDESDSK